MVTKSEIIPTTSESQGLWDVFDSELECQVPGSHFETSFSSTKVMDMEYNDSETEVCMAQTNKNLC